MLTFHFSDFVDWMIGDEANRRTPIMRLYYFTSERYGLEAIRDSRLKMARVKELNDPFDIVGHWSGNRDQRRVFRALRDVFHDTQAILCMSTSWQEPLLWGHYADKHKGMCLGFDVLQEQWMRVEFVPNRLPLYYESPASKQHWTTMLSTKFQAWEYEREYRAVYDLKDFRPDPVSGHYFAPFTDSLVLKEVIVGDRCTVSRSKLADVLGSRSTDVLQKKARPSFINFEVVEQRRKSLWK